MHPIGKIHPRKTQRSAQSPEWAASTAFQWRLLAQFQQTIIKEKLGLKEFAMTKLTPYQEGRLRALRVMLKMDYTQVIEDGEKWLNEHDAQVGILTLLNYWQ